MKQRGNKNTNNKAYAKGNKTASLNLKKPAKLFRGKYIAQARKTQEKHTKTHDCFAKVFTGVLFNKSVKEVAKTKKRDCKGRNLKIKTKDGNDPGCDCSTNVGTKNNAHRLCKTHKSSINKSNNHYC